MIRRMETRYGVMYVPDTDIGQYSWLELMGASVEDEHISAVRDLLGERETGTVIDVGASFGCWTLGLAASCKTLLAFEPQHAIRTLLNRSLGENRMSHVESVKVAVGAKPGEIQMAHLDLDKDANFGGLSMNHPLGDQPEASMVSVPVVRLDDMALEPVTFIKMDIEGMEAEALAGARAIIRRDKPLLFIETGHKRSDEAALIATIRALGYAVDRRGPNALCVPL